MKIEAGNRKYFLYIAITILLDGIIFLLVDSTELAVKLLSIFRVFVGLFWYYEIIKRSHLERTIYGKLLFLSFAILIIGALAKLEHWWFASYALIIGMSLSGLIYLIRFLAKRQKKLLDVVKLLFFELTVFVALAKLEHWQVDIYELVNLGLFYALIYLFSIEEVKPILEKHELFSFEEKQIEQNA